MANLAFFQCFSFVFLVYLKIEVIYKNTAVRYP